MRDLTHVEILQASEATDQFALVIKRLPARRLTTSLDHEERLLFSSSRAALKQPHKQAPGLE
jgi:hypothetical protein